MFIQLYGNLPADAAGRFKTKREDKLAATTGPLQLESPKNVFERAQIDTFKVNAPDVGSIAYVKVWHDSAKDGWFLESVEVRKHDSPPYMFPFHAWLAVDKGEKSLEAILKPVERNKSSKQMLADADAAKSVLPPGQMKTYEFVSYFSIFYTFVFT